MGIATACSPHRGFGDKQSPTVPSSPADPTPLPASEPLGAPTAALPACRCHLKDEPRAEPGQARSNRSREGAVTPGPL